MEHVPNIEKDKDPQSIENLKAEIQVKQSTIERLLYEVDRRSEAIKSCGSEIVKLRESRRILECEVHQLREKDRVDPKTHLDIKQKNIKEESKVVIQDHHSDPKVAIYKEKLEKLTASYRKLEHAHDVQGSFLQKLQADEQKISSYKATIQMQESVIKKLESIISKQFAQKNVQPSSSITQIQPTASNIVTPQSDSNLSSQPISSTVRIRALEEQLRINAQESASQISKLKLQILDLEMKNGDE